MRSQFFTLIASALALFSGGASDAAVIQFNDARSGSQHYIQQMGFNEAWGTLHELDQRHKVTVAVLDTGFDTSHTDLRRSFTRGLNILDGSTNVDPVNPHGTAVSGTIAARAGNGTGITGLVPDARVLPIRVTNRSDGGAFVSTMANAIRAAADRGARVINLSYSGVQFKAIDDAARYANRRGAVVFMAAGNEGQRHDNWTNYEVVMAVGAVDRRNRLANFSNTGSFVDFVAPGTEILTTRSGGGYQAWDGTSFSSPIAASVAALMISANPELTPGQIRRILRRSAVDLGADGYDANFGHGLIDAGRAVDIASRTFGGYNRRRPGWATNNAPVVYEPLSGVEIIAQSVPEPGTGLLALTGCWVLGARRRRP